MKFEFDNKTGGMKPKKDDGIYFSTSMSGGLRVDDKKNNIRYIIEKTGDIKPLSGIVKDINIYDRHDAYLIAERVKRMFGKDNVYSNPKRLMKGCHIVESFEEFYKIDEGMWKDTIRRAKAGEIRREEGVKVNLPNGEYVILDDKGCGLPEMIDGEYFTEVNINGEDRYIFAYNNDGDYTYYMYFTPDYEDHKNLVKIATSNYDMNEDDFIYIRAMFDYNADEQDMIESDSVLEFRDTYDTHRCECEYDGRRYLLFDSYSAAEDYAREDTKNVIEDCGTDKEMIERWQNYFGNKFIDTDAIKEMMEEHYKSYVEDIETEDGDRGNRLYDELIEHDLIEDTEDYFEVITPGDDENDPELDYDSPKFDVEDMKERYVEELVEDWDDPVEYYLSTFGTEYLDKYIDVDELARLIVDCDGICQSMGCSDDHEFEPDNTGNNTIYIYKE